MAHERTASLMMKTDIGCQRDGDGDGDGVMVMQMVMEMVMIMVKAVQTIAAI